MDERRKATVEEMRDKARGALIGVAVGDALGAPFEGMETVSPTVLKRLLGRTPLRYTDDTHMTIGMAESLVERRGFDGAHMAETFARNYAREPWRGYGLAPPQVFRLLEQGVPWDQAARTMFGGAGSYGNGAAMRVAPAALVAFHDLEQVAELARQTAIITHTHELGVEGAVLQALAVALLLPRPPHSSLDAGQILSSLRERVRSPVYLDKLERIEALLPDASPERAAIRLGTSTAAQEAVPAAIFSFLRSPDSFAEAVRYAITMGGDTDTIASMAGALAGAHLGEDAIPPEWRDSVESGPRLRKLADGLLELALQKDRAAG